MAGAGVMLRQHVVLLDSIDRRVGRMSCWLRFKNGYWVWDVLVGEMEFILFLYFPFEVYRRLISYSIACSSVGLFQFVDLLSTKICKAWTKKVTESIGDAKYGVHCTVRLQSRQTALSRHFVSPLLTLTWNSFILPLDGSAADRNKHSWSEYNTRAFSQHIYKEFRRSRDCAKDIRFSQFKNTYPRHGPKEY